MIKKRDRCKYRFNGPICINFSGADYLFDNDEFLMIFLERLDRLRLLHLHSKYRYYDDSLMSPPTYSYLAPRLAILFVVTKHLVNVKGPFINCVTQF